MQRLCKLCVLTLVLTVLSSCNAPLVKNALALPGNAIRGAAQTVGMGGVGGL